MEGEGKSLKKIVVFDNSFGGELFADYIEKELPIFDVIRVICWGEKLSRDFTIQKMRPYIGHADLIILLNPFLTITALGYIRKKFPNQNFIGLKPVSKIPKNRSKRVLFLTTKQTRRTITYQLHHFSLAKKTRIIDCDKWVKLIDTGEYITEEMVNDLKVLGDFKPQLVVLDNAALLDAKPEIRKYFGPTVAIKDGFKKTFNELCATLDIRGGIKKK